MRPEAAAVTAASTLRTRPAWLPLIVSSSAPEPVGVVAPCVSSNCPWESVMIWDDALKDAGFSDIFQIFLFGARSVRQRERETRPRLDD